MSKPSASASHLPVPAPPAVSRESSEAFSQTLPSLLSMVQTAILLNSRKPQTDFPKSNLDFVLDAQPHFGEMLRAVFELGLSGMLDAEWTDLTASFLSRELTIGSLHRMLQAWIIALRAVLRSQEAGEIVPVFEWMENRLPAVFTKRTEVESSLDQESSRFLAALLDNRKEDALETAISAAARTTPGSVLESLFFPSLAETGRLWRGNTLTVAQEHLMTANLAWVSGRFFAAMERAPLRKTKVAVACVPGDQHCLGAELFSRFLEIEGWPVHFYGAGMPEEELVRTLVREQPDAVVFSIRMTAFLPALKKLAGRIRKSLPAARILAGGPSRMEPALSRICEILPASFVECVAILAKTRKTRA